MSCAMVYWGDDYDSFFKIFVGFGAVVDIRSLHGKQIGEHHKHPRQLLVQW